MVPPQPFRSACKFNPKTDFNTNFSPTENKQIDPYRITNFAEKFRERCK